MVVAFATDATVPSMAEPSLRAPSGTVSSPNEALALEAFAVVACSIVAFATDGSIPMPSGIVASVTEPMTMAGSPI